jgi:hypothetical protein
MRSLLRFVRNLAIVTMIIMVPLCSVVAFRYRQWRKVSSNPEIADTPLGPLGKFDLGPMHFGAAFTPIVRGSYGGYCGASAPIVNPHSLVLTSQDCYALNLCTTIGRNSFSLLIPMPE